MIELKFKEKKSNILCIIVAYNAMSWASKCFGSLCSSSIVPDIFCVDNGSSDGTQEYITRHFPKVLLYQSPSNVGFGKANNIGIEYALKNNYEFVYLLNQDAWVSPDTLEKLMAVSEHNPEYGILSPFQMCSDLIRIDRNFKTNVLSHQSCPDFLTDLYNRSVKEVYPVKSVMAAHWLITSKCLKKVGGFSPSFPHYGEDGNYVERAKHFNFLIGIVPSLKAVHDRGERRNYPSPVYMAYIGSIRKLSNPDIDSKKTLKSVLQIISTHLKLTCINKTLEPIANLMKLFFNIRIILRNQRISVKETCPFITLK